MSNVKKTNNSSTFLALTSAALSLPGIGSVQAASVKPVDTTFNYRFSVYQDEKLPDRRVIYGSAERYNIDIHQFRLNTPVSDNYSIDAYLQYETLSGASPFVTADPDEDGIIDLIMSGASIEDKRTDLQIEVRRYYQGDSFALNIATSKEDDYQSVSFGFDWETNFNDKHTTFNFGASVSDDEIEPEDNLIFQNLLTPVLGVESKKSKSFYLGFAHIISANAVVQTGASFTSLEGFLTEPYRGFDQRPSEREQWTWSLRYRYFIDSSNEALHIDYRSYNDDWDISSHTVQLSLHKNVSETLKVIPSIRYYTQTEAKFYNVLDNPNTTEEFSSSDVRLSSYGAWSFELKFMHEISDDFSLIWSGQYYLSHPSYGMQESEQADHPAMINYSLFTVGFDYKF